ncbi:MAG: hypothetical protein IJ022_03490 [Burkholderiaceae bacterium]|nr:hypothetical protein [Burkholderiaceae bacterium]
MNRKSFLKILYSLPILFSATTASAIIKTDISAGTYLDQIFENLLKNGYGFSNQHRKENPQVVFVIDTQCPWCTKLIQAIKPLLNQIKVVWYPVAVLNDDSVTQGALILSASNPWKKLLQHEQLFKSKEHRGLPINDLVVSKENRQKVWNNSKIFRRAGGIVVPLGVFKDPSGKFIPIRSGITTDELRTIFQLKQ